MNIYVSNLSFNVQDEDLREFFTEYGEVTSAKVITDKFTGKSRGFGFVEMSDDEAAKKAIAEVAKERGYSYVIDASLGGLLYMPPADNLLNDVKKKLGIK